MKIGLFFGSFNPIHIGHLIIAQVVLEQPEIDEVWFIVSPKNPLKNSKNLLHEFDRFDLVEAAIRDNPKLKVSDIEFNLPKPNYTINTIVTLKEKYPDHQFVLIIGQDNLSQFPRWRNYAELLSEVELFVYPRPDSKSTELDNHPKVKFIDAPVLDISATLVRKTIEKGKSVKYLLPEAVVKLIEKNNYYR